MCVIGRSLELEPLVMTTAGGRGKKIPLQDKSPSVTAGQLQTGGAGRGGAGWGGASDGWGGALSAVLKRLSPPRQILSRWMEHHRLQWPPKISPPPLPPHPWSDLGNAHPRMSTWKELHRVRQAGRICSACDRALILGFALTKPPKHPSAIGLTAELSRLCTMAYA